MWATTAWVEQWAEMRINCNVAGFTVHERLKSSSCKQNLLEELQNQMRLVTTMYHCVLPAKVCKAHLAGWKPQGRYRTHWRSQEEIGSLWVGIEKPGLTFSVEIKWMENKWTNKCLKIELLFAEEVNIKDQLCAKNFVCLHIIFIWSNQIQVWNM